MTVYLTANKVIKQTVFQQIKSMVVQMADQSSLSLIAEQSVVDNPFQYSINAEMNKISNVVFTNVQFVIY